MVFNLNLTSTVGRAFEHLGGDMVPYKLSIINISETEEELQMMLDKLCEWCETWQLM